jgi:5-methylcytosine-specific restriction endonuclease McrA
LTPINNVIRSSHEYNEWEKLVLERDNYTCQKCKDNRIEKLVAHHILNFSSYTELRFIVDNGITFCRRCHGWFHRKYGRKNNTREQLNEFLTVHN